MDEHINRHICRQIWVRRCHICRLLSCIWWTTRNEIKDETPVSHSLGWVSTLVLDDCGQSRYDLLRRYRQSGVMEIIMRVSKDNDDRDELVLWNKPNYDIWLSWDNGYFERGGCGRQKTGSQILAHTKVDVGIDVFRAIFLLHTEG